MAVNCDAAWTGLNAGGLGVIIRDNFGSLIGGAAHNLACGGSVEIAEAQAILLGVNLATELNQKRVNIQSDSLTVITGLSSSTKKQVLENFPHH